MLQLKLRWANTDTVIKHTVTITVISCPSKTRNSCTFPVIHIAFVLLSGNFSRLCSASANVNWLRGVSGDA